MFTVDEANGMLGEAGAALERIRAARQVVFAQGERVHEGAGGNGGGPEGAEYLEAQETLKRDMEWFAEEGVILRDPESGLIDFPAEREGRVVYLCWQLGEDRITHWHEPETGFAGRQPL